MSKILSLNAEARHETGTGPTRALRRKGLIPAIIYGGKQKEVLLSLPEKQTRIEFHKQGFLSHIFDIHVGEAKYRAIPKSFQLHPVTDEIEHLDFIHVNENEKIKTIVILHFSNEQKCPGIKLGGHLNIIRHNLEIFALPSAIPEQINIDLENLNICDTIHVKDLSLPKGVETKIDPNATILTIVNSSSDNDKETAEETK